ncbi:MAG: MASE3 domain-containing protein [Syntrophobacteraceae bacterium]
MSSETHEKMSVRGILAGTFVVFSLPFVMVQLFPAQLDKSMDISSYLVFHNAAEFFSIMVSLCVFSVGWFTYDQSRDRHALFLGTAFLAVGLIDFMHTLSNVAMPAFITPNSTNKSTQYWIAARLLDSSAFLISAFIYPGTKSRWLSKTTLLAAVLSFTGLLFIGVTFFPSLMPATAVQGVGLTPLKRIAECVIIFLLIAAFAAYWKRMAKTGERHLVYYLAAFIIGIFSEAVFASYKMGFDTYNVLGHVYKIVAFSLIYKGIFSTSVTIPYVRLSDANEQLRIYSSRLEQSNRDLLDFCSVASHDLQEPLRKIHTFGDRIMTRYRDSLGEEGRDWLARLIRSAARMSAVFKALLEYSRMASRTVPFEPVDLTEAARHAASDLEEAMRDAGGRVEIGALPTVEADPEQMRQLFRNLIDNSIKYRRESEAPIVKIHGRTEGAVCRVCVEDNGMGFEDIYLDRMFKPFQRLHAGSGGGTGMGLAVCRRIVEQHGGGLEARGTPGAGSTFVIILSVAHQGGA